MFEYTFRPKIRPRKRAGDRKNAGLVNNNIYIVYVYDIYICIYHTHIIEHFVGNWDLLKIKDLDTWKEEASKRGRRTAPYILQWVRNTLHALYEAYLSHEGKITRPGNAFRKEKLKEFKSLLKNPSRAETLDIIINKYPKSGMIIICITVAYMCITVKHTYTTCHIHTMMHAYIMI